jgi:hypothetical protein
MIMLYGQRPLALHRNECKTKFSLTERKVCKRRRNGHGVNVRVINIKKGQTG